MPVLHSSIAEVIQFLALNELSLRGDYDKTEAKGMGHFVNSFEYTLMKDTKLAEIQKRISQNAKYISPIIQNDIINEMASMVTENVSNEVQSCDLKMFTLLADGTKDKSGFENISVSLRFSKWKTFRIFIENAESRQVRCLVFMHVTSQHFEGFRP